MLADSSTLRRHERMQITRFILASLLLSMVTQAAPLKKTLTDATKGYRVGSWQMVSSDLPRYRGEAKWQKSHDPFAPCREIAKPVCSPDRKLTPSPKVMAPRTLEGMRGVKQYPKAAKAIRHLMVAGEKWSNLCQGYL